MPENKKVKTPRLKDKDRHYLLKNKDSMLVHVKSFAASCRYGAGTNWCTSTPSNDYNFKVERRHAFLFVLFRMRNTEFESKFWISVWKRSLKFTLYGPDEDTNIDHTESFSIGVLGKELHNSILDYCLALKAESKQKRQLHNVSTFDCGQYIKGNRPKTTVKNKKFQPGITIQWSSWPLGNFRYKIPNNCIAKAKVVEVNSSRYMTLEVLDWQPYGTFTQEILNVVKAIVSTHYGGKLKVLKSRFYDVFESETAIDLANSKHQIPQPTT